MDWLRASAAQQGRAIMAGLLDPIDQTEAYLDAARAHPHGDRIYARLTEKRARDEAISAHDRARAGARRGLLDGVALSWKDNIDSAGVATEAGSRLLSDRVPAHDAAALARADAGGTICLGKTHMTELAFAGIGLNPMTATPPNALDSALAPGGSSSGAAVSVALGLAAAAIGSDTGGSIRLPATWNGLCGFKPSHGATPSAGVVPLCRRFDVVGPLARSVEDCAEIFALLRGERAVDLRGAGAAGLRLMVLEGVPFADAEEAPLAAFEDAVDRLARAGAYITRAAPGCVDHAMGLAGRLYAPEAYGLWRDHIEAAPDVMYDRTRDRFRAGGQVSASDYVDAWAVLDRLRAQWAVTVAGFDAVILPSVPMLPPPVARLQADAGFYAERNLMALRNTRIGNLLDLPAITLPTGAPACGLMAMAPNGADRALLRVAAGIEAALTPEDARGE